MGSLPLQGGGHVATKPPLLSSSHPHHGGKGLLASRNSFLAGGEQHLQPWKNFKVFLTKKVDLLQLLETESQAYEAYFYHFCWHFAWIFQRTPPAECLPCKWVHLPEWQVCKHGEQMWQCGGEHFVHFIEITHFSWRVNKVTWRAHDASMDGWNIKFNIPSSLF